MTIQERNTSTKYARNSSSQPYIGSFHHLCVTLPQQSFQHSSVGQVSRKTLLKLTRKNATQMSMTQLQTQMQMTRAFLFKFLADLICVFFTISMGTKQIRYSWISRLLFLDTNLFLAQVKICTNDAKESRDIAAVLHPLRSI